MRIDVFCAWGEAKDVGINIQMTPEEQSNWSKGLVPVDLTSEEARLMAVELVACADRADELERELQEYFRNDQLRKGQ